MEPTAPPPERPAETPDPTTEAPRPADPDEARPAWMRAAGQVALQLAIVFVGVYAAFALAQVQAERDQDARRGALRAALAEELGVVAEQGRKGAPEFAQLRQYVAAIDGGMRPPLQPLDTNIPFSPDVWEATLASGGLELLDPALVIRLSTFYSSVRHLMHQIDQNDEATRALLLPNLDRPPSEFYDNDGRIRPKYMWFRRHIGRLAERVPEIGAEADSLRAELLR